MKTGQNFSKLPETYVIFITEHDVLGDGIPIYHIERTIQESGKLFGDMEHIVYVNGEIQDDTDLGMLMHDFHCTQAKDMHYPLLANRVKYFKETQRGRNTMCAIVEQYAKDEVMEANRQAIIKGFRGGLTKEMAKTMYPRMRKSVIDRLYIEAKEPTRGGRSTKR